MSEAFADQALKLRLMLDRVQAGHDAAGGMAQHEQRQTSLAGFHQCDQSGDVAHIVCEAFDVEALAVGVASAAQVDGIRRKSITGYGPTDTNYVGEANHPADN